MSEIYNHIKPDIKKILKKAEESEEISRDEAFKLLKVTGKEFIALQQIADQVCFEKKDNLVTFIIAIAPMNSPIEKTKHMTPEETNPGRETGTIIFINAPTFDAPSMRAESSRSLGIVLK